MTLRSPEQLLVKCEYVEVEQLEADVRVSRATEAHVLMNALQVVLLELDKEVGPE